MLNHWHPHLREARGLVSSRKLNVFLVGTERTDEVLQLVSSNCKERAMEIEDQEYNGHMFVDVQKTIVIGTHKKIV